MKLGHLAWLACVAIAPVAAAQQQSQAQKVLVEKPVAPQFIVKTIDLHHLTSAEAVKLLDPYSRTVGGGVYEVPSLRAVTIRETQAIVDEMMALLARYDRDPANVILNFQLIAAENTGVRDPAVAGLDSLLRGVLKFSGYRLLGTSVASAGEREDVSQSIPTERGSYTLMLDVSSLRVAGGDASVHLNVSLWRPAVPSAPGHAGAPASRILMTGVTVPMGQTVVLGTTAAADSVGQRALILTVRPQLAPTKK
jgi:hypothetical protein